MKKKFFVVAAVIISGRLSAQQDSIAKTLDEVVITAAKFEQKQSQTGKIVSVINKEQLQKYSGRTVAQVLNEQASLTIGGSLNALGSVQTIFMRGASSGRTLLLIDGIPVIDPSMINNEYDLNLISINEVERIEICKGAQSTLYGSDAIAGVINIITIPNGVSRPFTLDATLSLGNKNTVRDNIKVAGKLDKFAYSVRFAKLITDGFSSAHDNTGQGDFDRDGYDGNNIHATVQYQVLPSLTASGFIRHGQYKADIDAGVFLDDNDYRIRNNNLSSGAGLVFKKGILRLTANYQYGELERKYLNDSADAPGFATFERNRYGGRTQFLEFYGNVKLASWLTILAGTDYRWGNMNQQFFSVSSFGPFSSEFADTAVKQTSYYGSLFFQTKNDRLHLEIGGRLNHHSVFGDNSTYTINPSYNINSHWRVFGSIASGFKAPSNYQLLDVSSGNPDLQPEKSVNYEIGVQQQHPKVSTRIAYFHRRIRNGLDFDYINFRYFNFIRQTVDGVELEFSVRPTGSLTFTGNYTLIGGDERTQSRKNFNDTTYNYLLRRPKSSVNLNLGYQFCKTVFASISLKGVSERHDVGGYMSEDEVLKGYAILNAFVEYKLRPNVRFFVDAQNLTGKKFYDIRGYNSIPFLLNGGINFSL